VLVEGADAGPGLEELDSQAIRAAECLLIVQIAVFLADRACTKTYQMLMEAKLCQSGMRQILLLML